MICFCSRVSGTEDNNSESSSSLDPKLTLSQSHRQIHPPKNNPRHCSHQQIGILVGIQQKVDPKESHSAQSKACQIRLGWVKPQDNSQQTYDEFCTCSITPPFLQRGHPCWHHHGNKFSLAVLQDPLPQGRF